MAPLVVDTSLPAHATSRALHTAQANSTPQELTLYGAWFCPFVQRTWITLLEKDIKYQYIEINPYKKDPWYLKLNEKGLVPTLVQTLNEIDEDGNKKTVPIIDSSVINEWLDERYDNHGALRNDGGDDGLISREDEQRSKSKFWIDHINKKIIPAFYKVLQHQPHSSYTSEAAQSDLRSSIETFVNAMDEDGPWFFGKNISMVDISLVPWARRLWLIDHYKVGGSGIPATGEEGLWKRWTAWKDAVDGRQSTLDTSSDDDHYLLAYKRYADDTTGSLVGIATRGGGELP